MILFSSKTLVMLTNLGNEISSYLKHNNCNWIECQCYVVLSNLFIIKTRQLPKPENEFKDEQNDYFIQPISSSYRK